MKQVKLHVNGIFNMSFGKTFFTGIVENHDSIIKDSLWQLIVNGKKVEKIEIEGEQFVKKTSEKNIYRSIAAKKKLSINVDLDTDIIELILIQ